MEILKYYKMIVIYEKKIMNVKFYFRKTYFFFSQNKQTLISNSYNKYCYLYLFRLIHSLYKLVIVGAIRRIKMRFGPANWRSFSSNINI